mmetsp:Transcript_8236/g.13091  ORF Transcript_8236/g.13091 Transcript_8236/m.13091 type:complete len:208 (+) Transcript_8236:540-1163(+)
MLVQLLLQEISIHGRVQRQERSTKASTERGFGLCDAALCASHLGSVARQEVIDSLVGVQSGHRWEHTKRVTSQEDAVVWVTSHARGLIVGDVIKRVGHTAILGLGGVSKVRPVGLWVNRVVLQQGIRADRTEDLRLILLLQVNSLGIAATLKVEDAIIVPSMLIVTKQVAARVSRQGGLASARQTKEKSSIASRALVGRAVHGHDAL